MGLSNSHFRLLSDRDYGDDCSFGGTTEPRDIDFVFDCYRAGNAILVLLDGRGLCVVVSPDAIVGDVSTSVEPSRSTRAEIPTGRSPGETSEFGGIIPFSSRGAIENTVLSTLEHRSIVSFALLRLVESPNRIILDVAIATAIVYNDCCPVSRPCFPSDRISLNETLVRVRQAYSIRLRIADLIIGHVQSLASVQDD